MSGIDPQEFGEVKGQVESISKILERHLTDCYEANKEVAKNLDGLDKKVTRLVIVIVVLGLLTFGIEGGIKLFGLFPL